VSDAVLGVSMTPTSVRTVLVAGVKADGVAVNHGNFDIAHGADLPTGTTTEQIIATILITRETAASAGYRVGSAGVTWLDVAAATALREGLATRRVDNVLLVSPFHSAIALARAAGESAGYDSTALLCIEPDVATLAAVGTADGMVVEVRRRFLPDDDDEAVGALADIVKDAGEMEGGPQGVFVVGSGVDVPLIMPTLVEAASLPVTAPEQPETALARGAALAAANTELLTASAIELARTEGRAAGYTHIALLCIEADSATSAILSTCDESIAEVRRRFLPHDDDEAVAALVEIVKGAGDMEGGPQGVFVVGSGVDIPLVMPALAEVTSLPVSAPEQPAPVPASEATPARSSLFASSTAFLNGQGPTTPAVSPAPAQTRPMVLEARGLHKAFGVGAGAIPIIHDINLQIRSGEFVAMVGPSGSGKSTLLSILGLLEPPTSGEVLVNGMSVAQLSAKELAGVRGRRIGYVFQSFNLLAGLSVAENVMLPSLLAGQSGRGQYDRAIALLEQFGLAGMAKRVPAELSGGEQQRVAIARALFMAPQVVLADEPTGNLDTKNGRRVIEALYDLNAAGQTIVMVTHDRSIADEAPRLVSLLDGRIESDARQARHHGTAWRAPH
jgi:putative ABC transport system ATP-binding protein